jgi:hypothetical protein
VAFVRTVKTASGATAVQIVHGKRRGVRRLEHVGSARDEQELEALKTAAAQRLAFLYPELDLGLDGADAAPIGPGPLPIESSRAAGLWDGLSAAYDALGFDQATGRDAVFRMLVLARIIEPTSKQDSLRVLDEVGVDSVPSYATLKRRLKAWAKEGFRQELAKACAAHAALGPASLVLYDLPGPMALTQGDAARPRPHPGRDHAGSAGRSGRGSRGGHQLVPARLGGLLPIRELRPHLRQDQKLRADAVGPVRGQATST